VTATDPRALKPRLDPEMYQEWDELVAVPGKLDAYWNPAHRLALLDAEGIAGEVLFHDFATPFVMSNPGRAAMRGLAAASEDQLAAGRRAYNRWVADFVATAPQRWRPMLACSFRDVDALIEEVHWAKEHGFAGISLPIVPDTDRVYQAQYDRVYSALEDTGLVLNLHVAISNATPVYTGAPNITASAAMVGNEMMIAARQLLPQLLFGGVLERHPRMKVVFTEMQSDWVVGSLRRMDYSYNGSALRHDIRDVAPLRPSEYWQRQCYLGSSLFSRAEIGARHAIGVNKMMLGMDMPHHEGAWWHGTQCYLQATLGAEGVSEAEAKTMLSETAAEVFGFDLGQLATIAERIGPETAKTLTPPTDDFAATGDLSRGDLNRPLMLAG